MRLLSNLCVTIQLRLSNVSFHYRYRLNDCAIATSKLAVNVFLYPNLDQGNVKFAGSYQKCSEVICNNNRYGSSNLKSLRSSYIFAYWSNDGDEIAKYNEYDTTHLQV